jgi:hypothetical protein
MLQLNLQVNLNLHPFFSEFREYVWSSLSPLNSVIRLYLFAY